jgi:hypothetical protein
MLITLVFEVLGVFFVFSKGDACEYSAPDTLVVGAKSRAHISASVCGVADGAEELFSVLNFVLSFYFLYVVWLAKEAIRRNCFFPGLVRYYEPWSRAAEASRLTEGPQRIRGSQSQLQSQILGPAVYDAAPTSYSSPVVLPPRALPSAPLPGARMPSWAPMSRSTATSPPMILDSPASAGMPSWVFGGNYPVNTLQADSQVILPSSPILPSSSPVLQRSLSPVLGPPRSRARSTSPVWGSVAASGVVARSAPPTTTNLSASNFGRTVNVGDQFGRSASPMGVARSLSPVTQSTLQSLADVPIMRPRSFSPVRLE